MSKIKNSDEKALYTTVKTSTWKALKMMTIEEQKTLGSIIDDLVEKDVSFKKNQAIVKDLNKNK